MGIDVQITLTNEKTIMGLFRRLRKIWRQKPMVNAMQDSLETLSEDAKLYVPVYHGDLRDSIMYEAMEIEETEYIGSVWSDSSYAVAQEEGVPAGFWMNMDNMTGWVLDKWGNSSFEPPGFELSIYLFEHGIEAKWYFTRAIDENQEALAHKHLNAVAIVLTSKG